MSRTVIRIVEMSRKLIRIIIKFDINSSKVYTWSWYVRNRDIARSRSPPSRPWNSEDCETDFSPFHAISFRFVSNKKPGPGSSTDTKVRAFFATSDFYETDHNLRDVNIYTTPTSRSDKNR